MSTTPVLTTLQKYPGMLPIEAAIFNAWLANNLNEFQSLQFNTRVGPGVDPGPTWPDNWRQNAVLNSKLRIDAIGWNDTQSTIIEVKDRAGTTALGELIAYAHLWEQENPGLPAPRLMLITNAVQAGLDAPLAAHGVEVYIVVPNALPGPTP